MQQRGLIILSHRERRHCRSGSRNGSPVGTLGSGHSDGRRSSRHCVRLSLYRGLSSARMHLVTREGPR